MPRKTTPIERAITIKDIAQRCGVGLSTVSRAFRDASQINSVTRERILLTAAEMGYDPAMQDAARRLRLRRHGRDTLKNTIALIFPSEYLDSAYNTTIYNGAIHELAQYGFTLVVVLLPASQDELQVIPLPPILCRGDVDGILCAPGIGNRRSVLFAMMAHPLLQLCPVVIMLEQHDGLRTWPSIIADEEDGAYQGARHLTALGHQHILQMVHPGETPHQSSRISGVKRALAEAGLDPDIHHHTYLVIDPWMDAHLLSQPATQYLGDREQHSLVQYLRAHPEVTAIMGINDATTIQAWRLLRKVGYRIPQDISLIGFDDTDPLLDEDGNNMLTTIHLPLAEIGREAAQFLLRRIHQQEKENHQQVLSAQLIIRGTTGIVKR